MNNSLFSGVQPNNKQPEKINFYVPGFFENTTLYALFVDFMEHIPQWFYDDCVISAAYGTFPNCIWNGGRTYYDAINRPAMERTIEELNKRGIAVRYTWTNPLLEEKHMTDIFANVCMEVADNGKNEVLVNTQVIEDYVRTKYPSFKIISSTTKCLKTLDLVEKELEKDYYLVVLDSSLNLNEGIFSLKGRDRLEVLVDHGCMFNCPNREHHYLITGEAQLRYDLVNGHTCPATIHDFNGLMQKEHFISREMINEKFVPAGFKHFKLDGRSFQKEKLVDSLLYYLVKPEFRARMKEIVKKEVYLNTDVW